MSSMITRTFLNTRAVHRCRQSGMLMLHTGSKQPNAMPASKRMQNIDLEEEHEVAQGFDLGTKPFTSPPPDEKREKKDAEGPKYRPRRKPGISDFDEFMKIQEAWSRKLPLDEDPHIPKEVIMRPVRTHTQATMRKMFSNEALISLQRKYDWGWGGFMRYKQKVEHLIARYKQRFIPMRHGIMGPDLAAGHFVTYRGGRVKFVGHTEWFLDNEMLPNTFNEDFLVQKIDATTIDLRWEGMDNLGNLYYLEDMNLTNNPLLDVWAFDKLYRQYRFSTKLKKLNVSRCPGFCERSLESAWRIPSLEEIIITDTSAAEYKFLELVILLLQDINPKLKVVV